MAGYDELIDRLYALHAESDRERRRDGLSRTVTDDVEFYGNATQTVGLDDFVDVFHTSPDEGRLVRTTAVEEHRGWLRNGWRFELPGGDPAVSDDGRVYGGVHVSQLSDDGRLHRLVPFLGDQPPPSPAG